MSVASPVLAGVFFTTSATWEAQNTAVATTLARIVAVKRTKQKEFFFPFPATKEDEENCEHT